MKKLQRSILALATVTALALLTGCSSLLPQPSDDPPTSIDGIPTDVKEASIVFIGDSIMSGYGTENEEGWPDILAKDSERSILNLGCAGAGFVNVGDCGVSYEGLVRGIVKLQPQVVVIQGSDNDFGYELDTVKEATDETIKELHQLLPNTRIVGLNTLMWRYDEFQEATDTNSKVLETAVKLNGGYFVSIGQPTAGVEAYVQDDLEHPSDEGQAVIAKAAKEGLASVNVLMEYTY